MKKIILNLIKRHEQKSKLDLIVELLLVENTVEESITMFGKVKEKFLAEMAFKQSQIEKDIRLIRSIAPIKKTYDPIFDEPLSKIEVDFEIVKSN